jgi:hypothetical protein
MRSFTTEDDTATWNALAESIRERALAAATHGTTSSGRRY